MIKRLTISSLALRFTFPSLSDNPYFLKETIMITLRWSNPRGKGIVTIRDSFKCEDRLTQLDALGDWIALLKEEYDRLASEGIYSKQYPERK
jgi:hypothetical protein